VQAAALAQINKVYEAAHLQDTTDKSQFKQTLHDATAEALDTGAIRLSQDQFVMGLGPESGPAAYQQYLKDAQFGSDRRSVAEMSPDQIATLRQSYQPRPGEEGAALIRRRQV